MRIIGKLNRLIKRLIRQLDINEIPPVSLLFLGGCLILATIAFFSWRSDRVLLENGREIRAEVIDRQIKSSEECDDDGCTTEISYFITYSFQIEGESYIEEQVVDRGIFERTERTILVRYLPERPSTSNVAETVKNVLPFPLFSVIALFVGLLGGTVIYRIS